MNTEPEQNQTEPTGFVKAKIQASTPKNRGKGHARASRADKLIRRAKKKLAEVLEFADQDVAIAMEVLRDQMLHAKEPKIRQDAALAILAYKWGRPVERSISANLDADDFPTLLAKLQQSPAFLEEYTSQKAVEGKEIPPELPGPQQKDSNEVAAH